MGQYHKLVNLDKKEVVEPAGLGFGAKQYEHTGVEGSLSDAIYLLVMSSPNSGGGDWLPTDISGRWAGDRVVVLGDYTRDKDLPDVENAGTLFAESAHWADITAEVRQAFTKALAINYVNKVYGHTKSWQREGPLF